MTFIACLLLIRLVHPSDDRRGAGATTAMQFFSANDRTRLRATGRRCREEVEHDLRVVFGRAVRKHVSSARADQAFTNRTKASDVSKELARTRAGQLKPP